MAKNFPYFKFIAAEWLTGDIVFESFESQGLFINICALYWQRDGNLSLDDLMKRYKDKELIESLNNRFFTATEGLINIKFLDEQLIDAKHISKVNSENGKKGAKAKRSLSEQQATAQQPLSDRSANSSKEKRKEEEENKRKENKEEKTKPKIKIFVPPFLSDFLAHAITKVPDVNISEVTKKFKAWELNEWHDGNGKQIKDWKLKLNNTLPFISTKANYDELAEKRKHIQWIEEYKDIYPNLTPEQKEAYDLKTTRRKFF